MTTTAEENTNTMVITVSKNDIHMTVDDLMMNEEEKMMDEEVTSVESEGDMEESMFTVAVLNSLVDQSDDAVNHSMPETGEGDPRPDAAPSSLDDSSRSRKRSWEDHNAKKAKTVPNPLSRPRELPSLKQGKLAESANRSLNAEEKGGDDHKKKVVFSNQLEPNGRSRGFSIDLDSLGGLEFSEVQSDSNMADTASGSRKRAFSFECFAFGINADEPLPTLESSGGSALDDGGSTVLPRMRSDSIVFDPASFHDGGIFEQAALSQDIKPPPAQPSRPSSRKSRSSGGAGSNGKGTNGVTAFTANISVGINPSGSSTFPMELLNKDGRIGIYLPEARRARIERFHAKRSKRVWRKRIKYDCRKKLADSRPRVKGRFVKRVD